MDFFSAPASGTATQTLRDFLVRRVTILMEKIHGLDFSIVTHADQLGLDPALAFRSSPSGNRYLGRVLANMHVGEGDRILDIGCGKGSAMRSMLAFPFGAVDGLELSPQLADVARRNFARLRTPRAAIFTDDATAFARYGDYNFFYMYNPFPASVMQPVLAALAAHHQSDGERIIIYNNPTCHAQVVAAGWTLMRTFPDQWGNGIGVYSDRAGQSRLAASVGDAFAA